MKNIHILLIVFFIATNFTACSIKETLHADEIIRKHNLTQFPYWDSENTPFRKNATLYANQETDSCLLVLKNKEGDTILSHLDKSIVNMTLLQYEKNHNDWIVIKRDYGKTIYDSDSTGERSGSISGSNFNKFSLDKYYTIDIKKKELKQIKPISKKEFLDKIASKFSYLKNCTIAALNNTTTFVFKDTLNDKQALYQLETKYVVKYTDGKYVVEPKFESSSRNGIFKNGITIENGGNALYFGEKIFFGKNYWEYNPRYKIDDRKYYRFNNQVRLYNYLPGLELIKTQIIAYDLKDSTTITIKDFPKDSLFDNHNIVFGKQTNKKIYIGIDGPDHSNNYFYELDTVKLKLIKLKDY
jgi:hypothetical protein